MSRHHPWPHAMGNIILIFSTVSEILDHCQNLLDDARSISVSVLYCSFLMPVSVTFAHVCTDSFSLVYAAEKPPFGKELLFRLSVFSLCIKSIRNFTGQLF